MQITTTEELMEHLKSVLNLEEATTEWRSVDLTKHIFPVFIYIDDYGNVINGVTNVYKAFKNECIEINTNTLEMAYYDWSWWNSKRVKIQDRPSGICNILYREFIYFTSEEEAVEYVNNYAKNNPEKVKKFLEKHIKETRSLIKKEETILKKQLKNLKKLEEYEL